MSDHPPISTDHRIGVILCQCGGKIAEGVDLEGLAQAMEGFSEVVYTASEAYPCSRDGQERLAQAVHKYDLERVLVAGCSPRLVEGRFRKTLQAAGLPGEYVEVVNIREIYSQGVATTAKAAIALETGLAKLCNASVAHAHTGSVIQAALVLGGGLGGLTIALQLAGHGIPVKLVEASQKLGGSLDLPAELRQSLDEQVQTVLTHERIRVYLGASLVDVQGVPGDYLAQLEYIEDDSNGADRLPVRRMITLSVGAILVASEGRAGQNGDKRLAPQSDTRNAALLGLPQDRNGYLVEPRWRLRPGRAPKAGIYLCGEVHQPADAIETLYQAYQASAKALRFLRQTSLEANLPVAVVDATLCTGCGSCVPACPTRAIHMVERLTRREIGRSPARMTSILPGSRADVLSLSKVEPLACIGCGSCTVACPVKAIDLPGWNHAAILAQIEAALRPVPELFRAPLAEAAGGAQVLVMACEWGAYAAAEILGKHDGAGKTPDVRLLRLNCSARFDPDHVLWAFLNGADGVLLGACPPGTCHYADGNFRALQRYNELKRRLAEHGFDPRRLGLAFVAGDDAAGYAQAVNDFVEELGGLYVTKVRNASLVAR